MASNLYVHLHSWATGGWSIQSFLSRKQQAMALSGLAWINLHKDSRFYIDNQQDLLKEILNSPESKLSQGAHAALEKWQERLQAGDDILLSLRSGNLERDFERLNELFQRMSGFANYTPKYFITLGRPLQVFREYSLIHPLYKEEYWLNILANLNYTGLYKKLASLSPGNLQLVRCDFNPQSNDALALKRLKELFLTFLGRTDYSSVALEDDEYLAGKSPIAMLRLVSGIANTYRRPDLDKLYKDMLLYEKKSGIIDKIQVSTAAMEAIDKLEKEIWLPAAPGLPSTYIESSTSDIKASFSDEAAETALKTAFPAEWKYLTDNYALLSPEQRKVMDELTPSARLSVKARTPLLSVLTMSYQHERFIEECIESVAMQKCDFPIQHIIVDDCSRDSTRKLIEQKAAKYPHIVPVFLPRKKKGLNIESLFKRCQSEYVALCDGDDYFTDPYKLQKQVDFLGKNKDCSLCFHYVNVKYDDNSKEPFIYPAPSMLPRGVREKYYLADLLQGNFIQTNSVVYRWRFRDGLPDWFRSDLCPSDWYWHLLHAEMGKIGFLPEVMSVYRRHSASLYAKSFQATSREHRRQHGYRELKTYDAVNTHFKDRYFRSVAKLADGVFSDFCQIMIDEDDSDLLNAAVEAYPKFGLHFLRELDNIQKNHPKAGKTSE